MVTCEEGNNVFSYWNGVVNDVSVFTNEGSLSLGGDLNLWAGHYFLDRRWVIAPSNVDVQVYSIPATSTNVVVNYQDFSEIAGDFQSYSGGTFMGQSSERGIGYNYDATNDEHEIILPRMYDVGDPLAGTYRISGESLATLGLGENRQTDITWTTAAGNIQKVTLRTLKNCIVE